jgi:hypothetical protein
MWNIKKQSRTAKLLRKVKLIIWDEVLMTKGKHLRRLTEHYGTLRVLIRHLVGRSWFWVSTSSTSS